MWGSPRLWCNRYHSFGWCGVFLNKIGAHSLSLYVLLFFPYAGSTLKSFRRFSNIVLLWLTMPSYVIEKHHYYYDTSVTVGEDSFESLLNYGLHQPCHSSLFWSPENGTSPINFCLGIMTSFILSTSTIKCILTTTRHLNTDWMGNSLHVGLAITFTSKSRINFLIHGAQWQAVI